MSNSKSFISDLFDFSFSKFLAPKIVGFLYILGVFFSGLGMLAFIFGSLSQGIGSGIVALIVAPLGFLLYVIFIRISLEGMIIGFRTAENTGRTAENTKYLRQP
ncbi:MAG: DUF4282 domain-containing protein [Rivularia sp. (in: cyanobacteria)]